MEGDVEPVVYLVYGSNPGMEALAHYTNKQEAIAYAKGFCSNLDMGGFDSVWVKAYAHEDGPYVVWSKHKGE